VLVRVVGTNEACGFDIPVGQGRAVVISAAYPTDIALYRAILETLGARAALRHDAPHHGIFLTSTAAADGARFLHLLNLDGFDKTFHLTENGQPLFDGRALRLREREGLLLPLNLTIGAGRIVYATAEITAIAAEAMTFRLTQDADVIALETDREIIPCADYALARQGATTLLTARQPAGSDDRLTVRWR
jgi:beta-galactosidase